MEGCERLSCCVIWCPPGTCLVARMGQHQLLSIHGYSGQQACAYLGRIAELCWQGWPLGRG
jgi:hypothetical protein